MWPYDATCPQPINPIRIINIIIGNLPLMKSCDACAAFKGTWLIKRPALILISQQAADVTRRFVR
jgi:hypothetical protein